jgi:hypothetical protein
VLAAAALILAAAAAGYYAVTRTVSAPGEGFVYPDTLPGGYSVARVFSGEEATRLSRQIHWSPEAVDVVNAAIVEYTDGTRIWIAVTASDPCSLVERMAAKILEHEEQLPYSRPVPHQIGGRKVQLLVDKRSGKLNAFWCTDHAVVWVEIGASGLEGLRAAILASDVKHT